MDKHTTIISSDEPVKVEIGGDNRWFRMFSSIIESGVWCRLSPSAAKVLVTLAKYADSTWVAWPGISTIQGASGVKRRAVYYAIDELEKAGVLLRRVRGGGATGSVYQLLPAVVPGDLFNGGGVSPVIRGGCTGVHGGGARGCTKGVHTVAPELYQRTIPAEQQVKNSAAAEISEFLLGVGVGEPVRSEIAGSGLSLSKIRKVVSRWRKSGKAVGALVLDLRVAVDREPLEQARAVAAVDLAAADAAQRQAVEDENRALNAWYESLGTDQERQLRQKALESLTSFERRLVGTRGPLESRVLLNAMRKAAEPAGSCPQ